MMRGAKQKIALKPLAITAVVLSVVMWLGFTVYKEMVGEVKKVEGPVEFTGPGFQTDPYILLLLTGLIMVLVAIASRYLRSENA